MTWSITDQVRQRGRPRGPRPEPPQDRVPIAISARRADDGLDALTYAARDTTPACADDNRYTSDRSILTTNDLMDMRSICRTCPLYDPCNAYATAVRPPAGFWAGASYEKRGTA